MNDAYAYQQLVTYKLNRIENIVGHRTDWGTVEDETSDLFRFLLTEREELLRQLGIANRTIEKLKEQLWSER